MKVLLVVRDAAVAERVARALRAEAAAVETRAHVPVPPQPYDLAVLDLAACRDLQAAAAALRLCAPAFVCLAAEKDLYGPALSVALASGASDVVPLTLEGAALARRVLAGRRPSSGELEEGGLRIDVGRRTLRLRYGRGWRRPVELPLYEFELLKLFLESPGIALPRAALLERLWPGGKAEAMNPETLDRHIQRLRRRLGPAARRLRSVRGVGYVLERE
ncbi:MAG: winged helix-turn-helix domain-containing protein [Elusimicrobiota bacterium]